MTTPVSSYAAYSSTETRQVFDLLRGSQNISKASEKPSEEQTESAKTRIDEQQAGSSVSYSPAQNDSKKQTSNLDIEV